MEFEISYTNKEITPWGGMIFLKRMLEKMGFRELVEQNPDLPRRGSNRGYQTSTIIESFVASIWCGANRFMHTEVTRHDAALGKIFGWKNAPGQDVYRRFFSKFTQAKNLRFSEYFYSWIFDNFKFDNFTLDIDSSVMTRYGVQDGAKKGYNPVKKGRPSHHPLIAFIADVKLVANMWLRSGDTSSANNFLSFLEDTLSKLKNAGGEFDSAGQRIFSIGYSGLSGRQNTGLRSGCKVYAPCSKAYRQKHKLDCVGHRH